MYKYKSQNLRSKTVAKLFGGKVKSIKIFGDKWGFDCQLTTDSRFIFHGDTICHPLFHIAAINIPPTGDFYSIRKFRGRQVKISHAGAAATVKSLTECLLQWIRAGLIIGENPPQENWSSSDTDGKPATGFSLVSAFIHVRGALERWVKFGILCGLDPGSIKSMGSGEENNLFRL